MDEFINILEYDTNLSMIDSYNNILNNTKLGKKFGKLFVFDYLKFLSYSGFKFNDLDTININDFIDNE
jgi:hypothetical protein